MQKEIAPLHDLVINKVPFEQSVQFSPDGRLYVHEYVNEINIWELAVHLWPEVLGTVLGIMILCLIAASIRVARRSQIVGALHCRGCNYDLSTTRLNTPCSECGASANPRNLVIGRPAIRRLAAPIAVTLVFSLTYAALFVSRFPRDHPVGQAYEWWSPGLAALAKRHSIAWLYPMFSHARVMKEVDPATGLTVRTVKAPSSDSAVGVSISPDGRTGITTLAQGQLCAFELPSGRVIRTSPRMDGIRLPSSKFGGSGWVHAPGWLNGTKVYVQAFDEVTPSHRLYLWDVSSGHLEHVCNIPLGSQTDSHATVVSGRAFTGLAKRMLYLQPGSVPPIAYEVRDRMTEGGGFGEHSTMRVLDLSKEGAPIRELKEQFWAGVAPVFIPEQDSLLIRGWGSADILKLSLSNGTLVGETHAPGFMGTLQSGPAGLAYHAGSGRLFVATSNPDSIHVWDDKRARWIADLNLGGAYLPDDYIALSPDGRWAAIFATTEGAGFIDHLLIFDLSGLESQGAEQVRP